MMGIEYWCDFPDKSSGGALSGLVYNQDNIQMLCFCCSEIA
jgi:hypothetical protein